MSKLVTIEELALIPIPEATPTYSPLGHHQFVNSIRTIAADMLNLPIIGERYEVARDGAQLFSTLVFDTGNPEMGLSVGMRNSLDRSMSVGLCIGSAVLVCSNMMFSTSAGGITLLKKHSKGLMETLEQLTIATLYRAKLTFGQLIRDAAIMKSTPIDSDEAFRLVGWLYGYGLLTPRQMPIVIEQWKTPDHEAFKRRNAFSLYNACTEAMKGSAPVNALERYAGLHSAFVNYCNARGDIIEQPLIIAH